mmetsp:Transcript_20851/g.58969  ORF Transcript_20851/g.58969 Transcript_20851/m.58969 type:complete len:231 (-) Transcript_20851:1214-1906(-)
MMRASSPRRRAPVNKLPPSPVVRSRDTRPRAVSRSWRPRQGLIAQPHQKPRRARAALTNQRRWLGRRRRPGAPRPTLIKGRRGRYCHNPPPVFGRPQLSDAAAARPLIKQLPGPTRRRGRGHSYKPWHVELLRTQPSARSRSARPLYSTRAARRRASQCHLGPPLPPSPHLMETPLFAPAATRTQPQPWLHLQCSPPPRPPPLGTPRRLALSVNPPGRGAARPSKRTRSS